MVIESVWWVAHWTESAKITYSSSLDSYTRVEVLSTLASENKGRGALEASEVAQASRGLQLWVRVRCDSVEVSNTSVQISAFSLIVTVMFHLG